MYQLKNWTLKNQTATGIILEVETRHTLHIDILEDRLIRVQLLKNGSYRLDRSWAVAPNGNAPIEGRNRASSDGFACPPFAFEQSEDSLTLGHGSSQGHHMQAPWSGLVRSCLNVR
ncbi:hypothetical protein [uncultured Cohaesibacter sp.]|uniref:hypothetical protein n=1 Tax=uncultured Cohaesibacter sp. TaxID=1002546 RepID=UPI00292FA741|nr:hypothetical protein [uncultured Cohaesibacter sp.]